MGKKTQQEHSTFGGVLTGERCGHESHKAGQSWCTSICSPEKTPYVVLPPRVPSCFSGSIIGCVEDGWWHLLLLRHQNAQGRIEVRHRAFGSGPLQRTDGTHTHTGFGDRLVSVLVPVFRVHPANSGKAVQTDIPTTDQLTVHLVGSSAMHSAVTQSGHEGHVGSFETREEFLCWNHSCLQMPSAETGSAETVDLSLEGQKSLAGQGIAAFQNGLFAAVALHASPSTGE